MSELARRMERARTQVEVRWDDTRAGAVRRGLERRRRRRAVLRAGLAALALLVIAGAVGWRLRGAGGDAGRAELAGGVMRFVDGSVARPMAGAELAARVTTNDLNLVEVVRGGASFAVTRQPGRIFRVEAGAVTVEVLGTEFTVERVATGARVAVTHGRVKVTSGGEERILGAGEGGLFGVELAHRRAVPLEPVDQPSDMDLSDEYDTSPPELEARKKLARAKPSVSPAPSAEPAAAPATRDWRDLAADGAYDDAFARLPALTDVHSPDDLLLWADVARLSHHAAEAVAPLEKLVEVHADDPRAPLAAFTLGRVLLEHLGSPREAARAFARAQALDPTGPLSEDALAREVEAWSRAGEVARARERAREYLARYPNGGRTRSVRRFGELE